MDTGNISRNLNQVPSGQELRLHPVAKVDNKDEAKVVLNEPQQDSVESVSVANENKKPLSKDELNDVVTKMNDALQNENRTVQFSIDEKSGRTVIKVSDSKTGEPITQFPSEEILAISRNLAELIEKQESPSGWLLKDRA